MENSKGMENIVKVWKIVNVCKFIQVNNLYNIQTSNFF